MSYLLSGFATRHPELILRSHALTFPKSFDKDQGPKMHFWSMIKSVHHSVLERRNFFPLFEFFHKNTHSPTAAGNEEMRGVFAPILQPPWMQQLQQPSAQISRKITTMYKKLETTHILFYIFALSKREK
jgi:hypothetical protein